MEKKIKVATTGKEYSPDEYLFSKEPKTLQMLQNWGEDKGAGSMTAMAYAVEAKDWKLCAKIVANRPKVAVAIKNLQLFYKESAGLEVLLAKVAAAEAKAEEAAS